MGTKIKRIIYKKIVAGDILKSIAQSNKSDTGGGARDLRFSPAEQFQQEFSLMFPNCEGDKITGTFTWRNGQQTNVTIHLPTNSRPNELRIGTINKCIPDEYFPESAEDFILLLIQTEDDLVHPEFITEWSLSNDNWDRNVKAELLSGLNAKRSKNNTPMGFIDYETGERFTNGK
mgnify:CR=1 FL=1